MVFDPRRVWCKHSTGTVSWQRLKPALRTLNHELTAWERCPGKGRSARCCQEQGAAPRTGFHGQVGQAQQLLVQSAVRAHLNPKSETKTRLSGTSPACCFNQRYVPKRSQPLKPEPRRCARSSTFHLFFLFGKGMCCCWLGQQLAGKQHARTHALSLSRSLARARALSLSVCISVLARMLLLSVACASLFAAGANDVNFYQFLLMIRARARSLSLSRKCMDWM